MAAKKKAATVPQSYDAANALLREHGELDRTIERHGNRLAARVAKLQAMIEASVKPLKDRQKAIAEQLEAFADARRDELTEQGVRKFHDMPAGRIGWRQNPPSVKWSKGFNTECIVEMIDDFIGNVLSRDRTADGREKIGIAGTFIRTVREPNKETMLANAELAQRIEGVRIGSSGETFYFEPKGASLSEGEP